MSSPFPGMDPYLEHSEIWPGFHKLLAAELVGLLNPLIGPRYYADVEVQTELEEVGIAYSRLVFPDTGVLAQTPYRQKTYQQKTYQQKTYRQDPSPQVTTSAVLEAPIQRRVVVGEQSRVWAVRVFVTETSELVTAIEILSPTNKRIGEGLDEYRRKRTRLLRSSVHLIEIDLLRGGERPGREVQNPPVDTDYVMLLNRANEGDFRTSEIWPVALDQSFPVIPVPLLAPDPDVVLDLQAAMTTIYGRAGYTWRIDYAQPVPPPVLRPSMADWLQHELPEIGHTNRNK